MKSSLRLFVLALLASLLLHLAMLGSGLLPETAIELPPDQALRKIDVKMQALQLEQAAPAATPTARLLPGGPASAVTGHKSRRKHDASAVHAKAQQQPAIASEQASEAAAASQPLAEQANSQQPETASAPAVAHAEKTDKAEQHERVVEASSPATTVAERPAGYLAPASAQHRFPMQAHLGYQTFYNGAMVGTGSLNWQHGPNSYTLEIRFNPIIGGNRRYLSQGQLNQHGLQPDSLQAWVGQEAKESARFDWAGGTLHFGDQGDKEIALRAGAQDVFSLAFQLGLKGGQLGSAPLQITTGKKVYDYPMTPSGETDYDTGSGKIRVIVFRAKGEDDITEFWLAPDFANLPVRISRTDKSKRVELRAVLINIDGTEQWRLPARPMTRNNH